jgi:hypothetical protein
MRPLHKGACEANVKGDEKNEAFYFFLHIMVSGDIEFARRADTVQTTDRRLYLPDNRKHNNQWDLLF